LFRVVLLFLQFVTVLIEANTKARHNSTGVKWGLGSTASANLQRHDVTGETSFFAKVDFVWTKERSPALHFKKIGEDQALLGQVF
jgi:hypothetical protein